MHDRAMAARNVHRVAALGFPEAQMLDICGPLEVFSRASRLLSDEGRGGAEAYSVELLARQRGPLRTSSGIELIATRSFTAVRDGLDTVLVAGGRGAHAALKDRALIDWVLRIAPRVQRIASVCTGAFVLAEAGLLDGKRATTHWASCERLAQQYPRVSVERDPIFIRQGRIYTSAGVTAGMDLALAMAACRVAGLDGGPPEGGSFGAGVSPSSGNESAQLRPGLYPHRGSDSWSLRSTHPHGGGAPAARGERRRNREDCGGMRLRHFGVDAASVFELGTSSSKRLPQPLLRPGKLDDQRDCLIKRAYLGATRERADSRR